jgi:site-specific recombinase XerD
VFYIRVIHALVDRQVSMAEQTSEEGPVDQFVPCLISHRRGREVESITLGHPLLDDYLAFVAVRARTNTWLAVASDLKIFFGVVAKPPTEVTPADVFGFLSAQRAPRRGARVVRLEDAEPGLAARTIARRLSSVRGLYAYLAARGDTGVSRNPVPTSLAARRPGARRGKGGVPLIRTPRTLPRVLAPTEVDALRAVLRTHRDRAMVEAMLLGGLRRCEVLGLRLDDVNAGERRVFVAEGKGGRQRMVPVSARFFATLGDYLDQERPRVSTDRVFVVLKGPRRGEPLSAAGLDEILDGARARAGLTQATCHQLRHTCFTRLREAGMALEAIQAQAGHASIDSTRIYLHLANDWLEKEYLRAAEAIEAQVAPPAEGAAG